MQRNWIKQSHGTKMDWDITNDQSKKIRTFTTRIDTIFNTNTIIVAPEHRLINELITSNKASNELKTFIEEQKTISPEDRISENREKQGVETGLFVINPFNSGKLPVWTANF